MENTTAQPTPVQPIVTPPVPTPVPVTPSPVMPPVATPVTPVAGVSNPVSPMQSPIPSVPPLTSPTPQKSSSLKTVLVGLLVLLAVSAAGAYYYYAYLMPVDTGMSGIEETMLTPTPMEDEMVACTMDAKVCEDGSSVGRVAPSCEFAPCPGEGTSEVVVPEDWTTSSGSDGSYSIKHPANWTITETSNSDGSMFVDLVNGEYLINIVLRASAIGPGVCIFPDDPKFNQTDEELGDILAASKCDGEYIEYNINGGVARRLLTPQPPVEGTTTAKWAIYTKGTDGTFATILPISFTAPGSLDQTVIDEMDMIVQTLKITTL